MKFWVFLVLIINKELPVITNRVKNFLSESVKKIEFDHTILHNKSK